VRRKVHAEPDAHDKADGHPDLQLPAHRYGVAYGQARAKR
jgi:hypothetical protein